MKTIVIFGVFDGLHAGHMAFINEANTYGDRIIAIVARDSVVEKLKNKKPQKSELVRLQEVADLIEIDEAYLGDEEEGKYEVLKQVNPDIICLGYDQTALGDSIKMALERGELPAIELISAKPFEGDKYHSSILN
jgi:FAD synthetase